MSHSLLNQPVTCSYWNKYDNIFWCLFINTHFFLSSMTYGIKLYCRGVAIGYYFATTANPKNYDLAINESSYSLFNRVDPITIKKN